MNWRTFLLLPILGVLLLAPLALGGCRSATPPPCPMATPYPTYTPYPTHTPPLATPHPSRPGAPGSEAIPWQEAEAYIGQQGTVQGKVIATHNTGKVVFLNFSPDYQHTLTAVIFPDDWDKFPRPPEELFYGQLVRITGLIEEYKGAPEIIIREPAQIEIIADTARPPCPPCPTEEPQAITPPSTPRATPIPQAVAPTNTPTVTLTPPKVIPFEEAADYIGQEATVEGEVVATYNSGKVVFLNFHEDYRHYFKVVMFPEAWPLFPQPPEELYLHQRVRVTGRIKEYEGAPEIIVESPEQIVILEGE